MRCNSWIVSWRMTTPSSILRPRIKAVCVELIRSSATELMRIVATFVKILKLTFSKQMGLYCWILLASCVLGSRVMTPKFRLNKGRSLLCNSRNICIRSPLMSSPKIMVKFIRETILAWSFIVFHVENCILNLLFIERSFENFIFRLTDLRYIIYSIVNDREIIIL